jgi:hypothetical protein
MEQWLKEGWNLLVQFTHQHPAFALLSTSALGGVVGAIISGFFLLRSRQNDYRNEYYKLVIQRRLSAYEQVEALISTLKTSVVDREADPAHPYHYVFANASNETIAYLHLLMKNVMESGLWLGDAVFNKLREFNELLFDLGEPEDALEFGKKHYEKVAIIRADLEGLVARDMLTLHDVQTFLKGKSVPDHKFVPFGTAKPTKPG